MYERILLYFSVHNRNQNYVSGLSIENIKIMSAENAKKEDLFLDQNSNGSDQKQDALGIEGKYKWPIRIISFLLLLGTIAINYVVGMETGQISDDFHLYVTPPGLFFTIWAVIFTLMFIANLINLIKNQWEPSAHIFLAATNILLIVWICVFANGSKAAVYICAPILIALVVVGLKFWIELGKTQKFYWFTYFSRNVYAFYLGWIIAAANLNVGIVLVYWWKVSFNAQLIVFWIVAPLCAVGATIFNTVREGKRGLLSCLSLWISVIWAFVGAAITSNSCLNGTGDLC